MFWMSCCWKRLALGSQSAPDLWNIKEAGGVDLVFGVFCSLLATSFGRRGYFSMGK